MILTDPSSRPGARPGDLALALLLAALIAFAAALFGLLSDGDSEATAATRRLVSELGLTDLCLFTEARYTRHPSQADLNSPFQDHPLALDHFPSGALTGPPPHLRNRAPLDR